MIDPAPSQRDPGLDLLRTAALLLMIGAHTTRGVLRSTDLANAIGFGFEAAPAVFFFAFGMTAHRLSLKTPRERIESILSFLYLGLCHQLCFPQVFRVEFFLFLWIWRTALALLEWRRPLPAPAVAAAAGALLAVMAVFPLEFFEAHLWPARFAFPVLPWGLFVLLGVGYGRLTKPVGRLTFFALGTTASIGFFVEYLWLGRPGNIYSKFPLSLAYLVSFVTVSVALVEVTRLADRRWGWSGRARRLVEYVSYYLLVGVAGHHLLLLPFKLLRERLEVLAAGLGPGHGHFHFLIFLALAGSSLACGLILLRVILGLWGAIGDHAFLVLLRRHRHVTALTILFSLLVLLALLASSVVPFPWFWAWMGVSAESGAAKVIGLVLLTVARTFVTYFALELMGAKTRRPS